MFRYMAAALIGLATLASIAPQAHAQDTKYPTKPVRIVVGFSPGSATDISARMIGPKLSERWGQPVIIENRSGAGGTLAAAAVAKSTPDGHTLLLISASSLPASSSSIRSCRRRWRSMCSRI